MLEKYFSEHHQRTVLSRRTSIAQRRLHQTAAAPSDFRCFVALLLRFFLSINKVFFATQTFHFSQLFLIVDSKKLSDSVAKKIVLYTLFLSAIHTLLHNDYKMKSHILVYLLSCFFATITAAPALTWKNGASQTPTMHHSEDISIQSLLPQQQGVVFILQRRSNGEEALSATASQLTQTAAVAAHCQHHSVTGVTSAHLLARSVSSSAEVTLEEYVQFPQVIQQLKTTSKGSKVSMKSKQRAQTLETATVLFVTVDTEQDNLQQLDQAVVQAIHKEPHVVLTAVRSLQEINYEKEQAMQYTMQMHREAGRVQAAQRRRLEEDADQQGQDNAQENMQINNNQYEYMVLVHMTPNILSGILFTILFATITLIGITCMGSIQGQDVYVKKMPSIGREA
jgi:hypothetical protein